MLIRQDAGSPVAFATVLCFDPAMVPVFADPRTDFAAILARREGREWGLREAILGLCEVLEVPAPAERRAALNRMREPELKALWERIKREHLW